MGLMSSQAETTFTVMVFDMARTGHANGERTVAGFATLADATAYAIARVRASVEALRHPGITVLELTALWHLYGEDCTVLDSPVRGRDLLELFIATPASPAECDWSALAPRMRRFRATLLISNDRDESVWCGGSFRSSMRLNGPGLLQRFHDDAVAAFVAKGIEPAIPAKLHVANHFELPNPPRPAIGDQRPLQSWKIDVGFVCHDVKFGGDASGVFAWPELPAGNALTDMTHLLMADMLAMRGDGPDYAGYSDVLTVTVAEVEGPPHYPLDG